ARLLCPKSSLALAWDLQALRWKRFRREITKSKAARYRWGESKLHTWEETDMTRLTTLNFSNPVGQAFWIMRVIFTVAPILFGLYKFLNVLTDWTHYLA